MFLLLEPDITPPFRYDHFRPRERLKQKAVILSGIQEAFRLGLSGLRPRPKFRKWKKCDRDAKHLSRKAARKADNGETPVDSF
jgi:hypothetical protein